MSSGIEQGTPILCRRCGAPTELQPDGGVQCRFCGTPDRLPPDELGRVLEIRGRLAVAAARVAQVSGTEQALAGIFEGRRAFFTLMGPWPLLALAITTNAVLGVRSTLANLPAAVPDATRAELVVAAAYGPIFVIGLTLAAPFALLVGRISYRRRLRDQLSARPPLAPGAPMRCRACGGELPPARDAFVACRWCRTQNLLAPANAAETKRRLEAEAEEHRARANGLFTATATASTRMSRTLTASFVLVYVGVIAFGMIATQVIRTLYAAP